MRTADPTRYLRRPHTYVRMGPQRKPDWMYLLLIVLSTVLFFTLAVLVVRILTT